MYNNILLVEDDYDDRDFFLEVLREIKPSLSCHTCENGFQALQMLEKLPSSKTLIFLDLNLPMMDGFEFLKAMKSVKNYKEIAVVVLTTSTAHAKPCKSLGASLYVPKPCSLDSMHYILSVILNNDIMQDSEFVEGLLLRQPSR